MFEKILRRNPPDVGVTSEQKPSTKIIDIVLQTSHYDHHYFIKIQI